MADRLRELLDLVIASIDEHGAGPAGPALAARAGYSRDHLDRILAAATGETAVALRRRLLLERAAWQLRTGVPATEAATAAGFGSLAAFSRAFKQAFGVAPSAHRGGHELPAPNGLHFHPPAGLLLPRRAGGRPSGDPARRLLDHHLRRVGELLAAMEGLDGLDRPLRPGLRPVWFEGEEASARALAEGLVHTLEVWVAAVTGASGPDASGSLRERFDRAARAFAALERRVREAGAWDDGFVDALCEPPQAFPYGGVVAHVLAFGTVRAHHLAAVLRELGADVPAEGDDPLLPGP
jgi:AraC family transcriptional regulator